MIDNSFSIYGHIWIKSSIHLHQFFQRLVGDNSTNRFCDAQSVEKGIIL